MKNLLYNSLNKSALRSTRSPSSESGFTLLELAVIVIMIGALSAIAAPAWNAFITRQRIRAVNNQVLQALQTAQAEAKRNKVDRKIEFDNDNDMPVYRLYESDDDGDFNPTGDLISETVINLEGEIKPEQIQIRTQANGDDTVNSIIFNHLGAVIDPDEMSDAGDNTDGFTVTVSTPNGGAESKRCVKVMTLLGATITAEGDDDQTGCP